MDGGKPRIAAKASAKSTAKGSIVVPGKRPGEKAAAHAGAGKNKQYPWVAPGGIYYHGVLYTQATKFDIEQKWRNSHNRLKRLLKSSQTRWRAGFGPPNADQYAHFKLRVDDKEVPMMAMKYPIKLTPEVIEIDPDNELPGAMERNLTPEEVAKLRQDVISIMGGAPVQLQVTQIKDPEHPAYVAGYPSYRCVAKKRINKHRLTGPPYAGVWRTTAETDALETSEAYLEGRVPSPNFNRWAYAYTVNTDKIPRSVLSECRRLKSARELFIDEGQITSLMEAEYDDSSDDEVEDAADVDTDVSTLSQQVKKKTVREITKLICRKLGLQWDGKMFEAYKGVRVHPANSDTTGDGSGWNIEATEVRNELSMVNDPRGFEAYLNYPKPWAHDANVLPVIVAIYNVRHIFFMTTAPIQPGEELFVKYGEHYWTRMTYLANTLAHATKAVHEAEKAQREAEESKRELEELQEEMKEKEACLNQYRHSFQEMVISDNNAVTAAKAEVEQELTQEFQQKMARIQREIQDAQQKANVLRRKYKMQELQCGKLQKEREFLQTAHNKMVETVRYSNQLLVKKECEALQHTLAHTTSVQTSAICIYSRVAELLGEGTIHPTGKDPQSHFETRCRFRERYRDFVHQCEKCGQRYMAGVSAMTNHEQHCELFIHMKAVQEAAERLQAEEEIEKQHEILRKQHFESLEEQQKANDLFGSSVTNTKVLQTVLEMVDDDLRIGSFLSGFIWAVVKAVQEKSGSGDHGVYSRLAEAMDCAIEEVPQRFLSVYQQCKCLCTPWIRDLMLEPNTPKEVSWIYPFAQKLLEWWDAQGKLPDDEAGIERLNEAMNLIKLTRLRIMELTEAGTLKDVSTSEKLYPVTVSFPILTEKIKNWSHLLPLPHGVLRRTTAVTHVKEANQPFRKRAIKEEADGQRPTKQVATSVKIETSVTPPTVKPGPVLTPDGIKTDDNISVVNCHPPTGIPVLEVFPDLLNNWRDDPDVQIASDNEDPTRRLCLFWRASRQVPGKTPYTGQVSVMAGNMRSTTLSWLKSNSDEIKEDKGQGQDFSSSVSLSAPANRIQFSPPITLKAREVWDIDIFVEVNAAARTLGKACGFIPGRTVPYGVILDENPIIVLSDSLPLLSLCHVYEAQNRAYLFSRFYLRCRSGHFRTDRFPMTPLNPPVLPWDGSPQLKTESSAVRLQRVSRLCLRHLVANDLTLYDLGLGVKFKPTDSLTDDRFLWPLTIGAIGSRDRDRDNKDSRCEKVSERVALLTHPCKRVDLLRFQVFNHGS
eukprot:Blabericola_migrator_1__8864@NODE_468_length_8228_cov_102_004044_g365_i0_p1_GENE_NODE_468_length_8228_cov_102_004044_g365_i0NODE_468_length_8228_cov_102_004044_g365_i0_p1_ORF_typecomplete_len1273_score232_61DUF4175/PF13779_6/0_00033DUF4175/PF13779_6/1_6e03Mitofilin/PF09731_9/0_0016Mitofilin/PF09731_9/5_3e02SET/PF00856_28/0_016DUF2072/PF09845_9/0_039Borrelia_P83/PF05262_11/0_012Borrelia_P83/PF05262_11/1e02Thioredoxin_14/PF18402_1/1_6DUF452/PF04301_13/2_4CpXC/PF14353_6/4_4e03CpXC/PF14353_6/0_18MAD